MSGMLGVRATPFRQCVQWLGFNVVEGGHLRRTAVFVATEIPRTRVRQFEKAAFHEHWGLRRAWRMTDDLG